VSFSDEGKRAAAPSRSGDVVQVLSKPPAKQAPRVHNIEAPDDETLAERARARANKW
jgi:hypothetical protein